MTMKFIKGFIIGTAVGVAIGSVMSEQQRRELVNMISSTMRRQTQPVVDAATEGSSS